MLPRFARGKFFPKNKEKYIGLKTPTYRSSWEQAFMRLCDEHPYVAKWEAANAYAKLNKIRFRVLSEDQLFHNGTRK